jgi:hypothetical protein
MDCQSLLGREGKEDIADFDLIVVHFPNGYMVHGLSVKSIPSWNTRTMSYWFAAIASTMNLSWCDNVGVLFMISCDHELQKEMQRHMKGTSFNKESKHWIVMNSILLYTPKAQVRNNVLENNNKYE